MRSFARNGLVDWRRVEISISVSGVGVSSGMVLGVVDPPVLHGL